MGVKASLLISHDVTFDINGQQVVVKYRRLSPLDQERINAENAKRCDSAAEIGWLELAEKNLLPQIDGWNIDGEDGKPLEITPKNICIYLGEHLVEMLALIAGRVGGEAQPGEDPNPSSTPSSISS